MEEEFEFEHEWKTLQSRRLQRTYNGEYTAMPILERCEVPSGWLYRTTTLRPAARYINEVVSVNVTFVPTPKAD